MTFYAESLIAIVWAVNLNRAVQFLQTQPDSNLARYELGATYFLMERYDESVRFLKESQDLFRGRGISLEIADTDWGESDDAEAVGARDPTLRAV